MLQAVGLKSQGRVHTLFEPGVVYVISVQTGGPSVPVSGKSKAG